MKELKIKKIFPGGKTTLAEAEKFLDSQAASQAIELINWPEFRYKPKVGFKMAHSQNQIWLKYDVTERHILARQTQTNGDVYKDSCVEFFISLDNQNYYNFEFNCIGTIHAGYGPGRKNRKPVPKKSAELIETKSTLGNQAFEEKTGEFSWELIVRIPLESFVFDKIESFDSLAARGNFYKCGDETSTPHFVTWNPVETHQPDYHRPEFFGKLWFE
jgi:hypothetical protein